MEDRTKTIIKSLVLCLVALSGCGAEDNSAAEVPGSGGPIYDPQTALIIFIPGLLGSEMGCGPDAETPVNLWPAEATTLRNWPQALGFSSLELVNTKDHFG